MKKIKFKYIVILLIAVFVFLFGYSYVGIDKETGVPKGLLMRMIITVRQSRQSGVA